MNEIKCACKNCNDRKLGCHATCEKYKEYKTKTDEMNRKIRNEKVLNYSSTSDNWNYLRKRKARANG